MYSFEDYTLVVYETPKELSTHTPSRRFVAYLREIQESTLHEYGKDQFEAIRKLKKLYESFKKTESPTFFPPPAPDLDDYSGKIVLRMPPWLHKSVAHSAELDNVSINSYICNRLIKATTIDQMTALIEKKHSELFANYSYEFQPVPTETKLSRADGLRLLVEGSEKNLQNKYRIAE